MTRRHTGIAVALLVAATALAAPGARAAGCAGVVRRGPWSRIDLPASSAASETAVVAGPGGRDVVYAFATSTVGQGRTLLRSGDGGCTWTTSVSLDAVGAATDPVRLDPAYRFIIVAAGPATPGKPHAVYALAGDDGYGVGVSLPVVTLVSADSGAHWTLHQPAPADLAGDYPRCYHDGFHTTTLAVVNASTAYLRCHVGAIGDVALFAAECADAYYVTRDAARTWTAIRGRPSNPAKATTTDLTGCERNYAIPRPSLTVAREVWDTVLRSADQALVVTRSRDDGATFTPYTTSAPHQTCFPCGFGVLEQGRYAAHPYVVAWNADGVLLPGGGGTLVRVAKPVPAEGKLNALRAATLVVDAAGTATVVSAWDLTEPAGSVAFAFDVARKRWRQLPAPPLRSDLSPPWAATSQEAAIRAVGSTAVYFGGFDATLFGYAGR